LIDIHEYTNIKIQSKFCSEIYTINMLKKIERKRRTPTTYKNVKFNKSKNDARKRQTEKFRLQQEVLQLQKKNELKILEYQVI